MGRVLDAARAQNRPPADGSATAEVLAHLEEVFASPPFRSSPRSQEFLRYVVRHSLAGEADQLKERLIGERIFGRPADYDTGQDSIVRVKANEVRRRLAQYYDLHPASPIRIDLPSGSYVPQIHHHPAGWTEVETAPPEPAEVLQRTAPAWGNWAAILVVTVLALAIVAAGMRATSKARFTTFWEPLLKDSERLTICIPNPENFRIYGVDRQALLDHFKPRPPGTPRPPLHVEQLRDVQIVPEPNLSLGLGDARALALIHTFVQGRGVTPQIRLAGETTFTELRANNTLLLAGFTNEWTLEFTKDLRYRFFRDRGRHEIQDGVTGKTLCRIPNSWEPPSKVDCALVTRLMSSKTGRPMLIAAGLNHYGTFAVGEFVTRPDLLESALAHFPEGWEEKNVQLVFQVEVVRDNVGPPKLMASHVW